MTTTLTPAEFTIANRELNKLVQDMTRQNEGLTNAFKGRAFDAPHQHEYDRRARDIIALTKAIGALSDTVREDEETV
ncbi:hypothetical protein LAV_00150 [Sphingobium phage Lacusarx]|uniref:Uncharacterized protein n=1 Tax=Sphingobium phage Lacusarx TaxID=1980139 RepID=A0A1W6DX97_9CAUD|nr:hypothetical protein FDH44_gp153 [Sphingobium phage Lacusarx]ARK07525.1 hypothetical protein LAV_00150 [Sphingobium phage Lacusarx]